MAPFDQEHMIDQLADRAVAVARLDRQVHRFGMEEQPSAPLVPLGIGIADQLFEGQCERHGATYFMTSSIVTVDTGPRFNARTPGSIVFRSPTTTTANLSGWM